jgi:hypothetical protein
MAFGILGVSFPVSRKSERFKSYLLDVISCDERLERKAVLEVYLKREEWFMNVRSDQNGIFHCTCNLEFQRFSIATFHSQQIPSNSQNTDCRFVKEACCSSPLLYSLQIFCYGLCVMLDFDRRFNFRRWVLYLSRHES